MATTAPVSSTISRGFLVAAVLLLLTGLYVFASAESIATLPADTRAANAWPWPIGPLALRFIASLMLSAALASYLVSRRADAPTVAAFSSVAAITSGMLLFHSAANLGSINWGKPLGIVWAVALVAALIASVLLALRARQQSTGAAAALPATPPIARHIAMFIFLLTGFVGAGMFLFPGAAGERWPWNLANTTNVQLLGAVFLSVGLGSILSWFQSSWYGYQIFYAAAGTFATVALVASFMHWNLFAIRPVTSLVFVVLYILGAILGFYPYFRYANRPAAAA